jgi:exodeoxyribonuclease VII large subunit
VVPDAAAERRGVEQLRMRARRALTGWVATESAKLSRLTSSAVLVDPFREIEARADQISRATQRGRAVVTARLDAIERDLAHRRAQLSALGPTATLARGYAVVQVGETILRSVVQAPEGAGLRIRLADGAVLATSSGVEDAGGPSRQSDQVPS